jgi:glutamine amidotransferase
MTPPVVAIVDYGVGNVTSVRNAITRLHVQVSITADPDAILSATHLIFPGVGSFAEGMKGITERGLVPLLREEVLMKKKPIFGICLGMQLFATEGYEHGTHQGLGFIPGTVPMMDTGSAGYRLPHIGWNDMSVTGTHPIAQGFSRPPVLYFVHSYHVVPTDPSIIAGVSNYGQNIVALLQSGTICGAQFHPEKSDDDGLQILKNFLTI